MSIDVDYLIIGSGLAGMNAALSLSNHASVLLVTKKDFSDNATSRAQGGIASVVSSEDSFEQHTQDTEVAGAGLCIRDVVHAIVSEGPKVIEHLVKLGVQFDKHNGEYDLTREGGHNARRILHAQDITGREIYRALHQAVTKTDITLWTHHIAVDLITTDKLGIAGANRCVGAYILNNENKRVETVRCKALLLATGGAGKVYLYTSNPDIATGDGIAMSFRAGAQIANMEFVQFHPTCLYHPRAKSFLISEALRGEGGILKTVDGRPFMRGQHPLADLAPRDIVARAIDGELKRSGQEYVTLDMTHHDPAFIASRFPNIHAACMGLGIDMTKVPIPVVPAAHYTCGGIVTDLDGQTDIQGLYAAGECAYTGLHGANRLASNSLLEAAVMSKNASEKMKAYGKNIPLVPIPDWDPGTAAHPDEAVVVSHNWDELRRNMWSYVGIMRSNKRLDRALNRILLLQNEIHEYYWDFRLTADLVELRNLATVAHLIVESARRRQESRGLHFTLDFPQSSERWCVPTLLEKGPGNSIRWLTQVTKH